MESVAIAVGQTLYQEVTARHQRPTLKERVVTKIGRQYFYVDNWDTKFSKETLRYESKEYSQHNIQLYLTKEEIEERWEYNRLVERVQRAFQYIGGTKKYTADQLRRIVSILDESK